MYIARMQCTLTISITGSKSPSGIVDSISHHGKKKRSRPFGTASFVLGIYCLTHGCLNNGLECFGIVHREVGKGFPVQGDVLLSKFSHEN
jgi:hypothetical protein